MCWKSVAVLLSMSVSCLADPPPALRPPPPPPPPRAASPERQYSAWQSIQAPLSRSRGEPVNVDEVPLRGYYAPSGRLPNESTHDLLDSGGAPLPRPRLDSLRDDNARRSELDRREYELYLHSGLNDQTYAAASDAASLNAAKTERDRALMDAQNAYAAQTAKPGVDHRLANDALVAQTREIQQRYAAQRARILGDMPTTQPSR